MMSQNLNAISMKASGVLAGVAFFGGLDSNFQMIIRCPVHVYSVIKRNLEGFNNTIKSRFFSGSIDIPDLVLPNYVGCFLYKSPDGKKVKKYHAAFVYPLMADYMVSPEEYSLLMTFCNLMDSSGYKYYDKKNRSIRETLNLFTLPGPALLEGFE